ncbi:MAG: dienelactone hydrolase family protein [Nitrospirae bacterium]|nr:dienelactone hydrolase family protein [Nitrospirota bacterium]MDA1305591.1 dienelactone hydrolase family protein [Nitrospirota bacterium]
MRVALLCMLGLCVWAPYAFGEVQTKVIPYQHGKVQLEGVLAWDDAITGKRPGVLVVHEWWGLNDYAKDRAQQLAKLGYVAFAVDMYGKEKITTHPDQAGTWMKEVQANVSQWQARAIKGLAVLRSQDQVDTNNIAAIGYCFGGATVIQLAFSGEEINGVVSFHGALPLPTGKQASKVKAKMLMAHGNADPFLKEEHIRKFRNALDKANVDWQMVLYSGARHSFTDPGADARGMDALKYDQAADERSWMHMQLFFDEIFVTP